MRKILMRVQEGTRERVNVRMLECLNVGNNMNNW